MNCRLIQPILPLLLAGVICDGCDANRAHVAASAPLKSASIGPSGGTLSVTTAESASLAGTSITIPPGALTAAVTITISASAVAVAQPGDLAAGPVVDFGPDGTVFAIPALLTIPVIIPSGESPSDLIIEAVEASGAAQAIAVDSQSSGLAAFHSSGFTRFGGAIHHRHHDGGPETDAGTAGCSTDSDCGACAACVNGQCLSDGCVDAGATCHTNADCTADSYCLEPDCASSGTCAARPQVCPEDCASPELCGCDGQWYCNTCLAAAAGTNLHPDRTACLTEDAGPDGCTADSDCGGCPWVCVNGTCEQSTIDCAVDGGPALAWYHTCGYPVCQTDVDAGPDYDAGDCPAIGTTCSSPGATCGTPSAVNCGVVEICSDHDPSEGPCPISSRLFKDDIEYLDPAGLEKLHDRVLQTKLATYHYKSPYGDPDPKHVGFIIEDQPESPAVDRDRKGVDVYNYLGMVVATMQVQEREIADLRHELELARRNACPARPEKRSLHR